MANHKSALKRVRQNEKRREANRYARSTYRTAIKNLLKHMENDPQDKKEVRGALKKDQVEAAPVSAEDLVKAVKLIDKAAIHGLLHKKTAARKISRLQKRVNAYNAKF